MLARVLCLVASLAVLPVMSQVAQAALVVTNLGGPIVEGPGASANSFTGSYLANTSGSIGGQKRSPFEPSPIVAGDWESKLYHVVGNTINPSTATHLFGGVFSTLFITWGSPDS
jgi:hypothetical protein